MRKPGFFAIPINTSYRTMSQQILQALMQLFAIIARPESNSQDRRSVVESFLKRQLSQELVNDYLDVFDRHYKIHQVKQGESARRKKRTASSSVRLLVICTRINEELNQRQKIIVLINLLEFISIDNGSATVQELDFVATVADTFNITAGEFQNMRDFVLSPSECIPDSKDILIIDNSSGIPRGRTRHISRETLEGQIRILQVGSVNMYLVRYTGNSEMYLNSQLIQKEKVYVFDSGTSLRNPKIKPVYYSDIATSFSPHHTARRLVFSARNIEYRFKGGNIGLQRMSFTEESGRLIGIMGSSGSGKTTLLNVLSGSLKPYRGEVLINDTEIHSNRKEIEGLIGYVTQDDLLIEELTVFQNLYYNARLCFDHLDKENITEKVDQLLQQLGLYDIRHIQVGHLLNKKISGGQRKRLNIALELIREPAVLFLDEPTSGLSSRDSENIMDLLKELSFKGKLIFAVIHQPSSDIFKMFDNLLILDTGGFLIYNGDPVDAIIYFKSHVRHANWNESECNSCGNVNPEQLFNIIETNVLDEFGKQTRSRRVSPWEWAYFQLQHSLTYKSEPAEQTGLPKVSFRVPGWFGQFLVFTKRDLLSKLSNGQYLVINLIEAPLLAFLLSYIIRYYDINTASGAGYSFAGNLNLPVYLFISVIVAIFIGLTVSAEEIFKDRKILKRESFLNLSWSGYLFSKLVILFSISAIQALLFVLVGNSVTGVKGMFFQYWLVLFSAWCFANITGLIISDSFKTAVTIYILIPFLVIPQLILSGIIVKYGELNPAISSPGKVPIYGEVIAARWAYEALAVHQFTQNAYEREFYNYNRAMSRADFMNNFWIRNLQNKLDYNGRNLYNPDNRSRVESNFRLILNELKHEGLRNSQVESGINFDMVNPDQFDQRFIESAQEYLIRLQVYYVNLYNDANKAKDNIISGYFRSEQARSEFLQRRDLYYNEALSDLVRNSKEATRIFEYNDRLIQVIDPVYREPEGDFIRAHFYSPAKYIFGYRIGTLWMNTIVIWIMTAALYLVLHFRVLKWLLENAEQRIDSIRGRLDKN